MSSNDTMRTFDTGATRSADTGKLDPEGFLSPLALRRYSEYLNKHRVQADGKVRDSDNWQKGIPLAAYMKSAWRHFLAWWTIHRGHATEVDGYDLEDSLCAVLFNVQGYLHETLKRQQSPPLPAAVQYVPIDQAGQRLPTDQPDQTIDESAATLIERLRQKFAR